MINNPKVSYKDSLWYRRHKEKQSFNTTPSGHKFITHPFVSIENKNSDPNINKKKLRKLRIDTPQGEELNERQLDYIYINKEDNKRLNKQTAQSVRENVFPNSQRTRRASTYDGLLLTPNNLSNLIIPVTPYYDDKNTNNKKHSKPNSKPAKNNSKITNSNLTKDIDETTEIDLSNFKVLI